MGTILVVVALLAVPHPSGSGKANASLAVPDEAATAVAGERPNILKFVLDDLSPGMMGAAFYPEGGSGVRNLLPKTSALLAGRGVKFTRFLTHTPSCCPSRATIATGRYDHNNGVRDLTSIDKLDMESTVQRYLHDDGYCTGFGGKYFNGVPQSTNPPYFDRWAVMPQGRYYSPPTNLNGRVATINGYTTSILGDQALSMLDWFGDYGCEQWYLDINWIAPHRAGDNMPVPEAKYATTPVTPWRAPVETDRSDKPAWIRAMKLTQEAADTEYVAMARTLMSVDDQMVRIINELQARGELSNTLIMLLPDNGYNLGEHGTSIKFLPYTPSLETGLLMRWDGHLTAGSTDSRMTGTVDIAPTMLSAAGITPDPRWPLDGYSLLSPPLRTEGFGEYWQDSVANRNIPTWATLRSARRQYIEWYDVNGNVTVREYYDLVADPRQETNLYGDKNTANDPPFSALSAQLARVRQCRGTTTTAACP